MSKRGLPETLRMRHDAHYVETLAASAGAPVGRMVPIEQVDPNPDQPRQAMGDLSELMASVAEKGIIEPLVVRQRGARYQIVAGERRYQAAVQVGPDRAAGRRARRRRHRDARDRARREHPAQGSDAVRRGRGAAEPRRSAAATRTRTSPSGSGSRGRRSPSRCRSTPCRRTSASCAGWPDIDSKSVLLQIVRQGDPQKMLALVEKIATQGGATREQVRQETQKPKPGRPKAFVFNFRPPSKAFNLRLSFNKKTASKDEIISALEAILDDLRSAVTYAGSIPESVKARRLKARGKSFGVRSRGPGPGNAWRATTARLGSQRPHTAAVGPAAAISVGREPDLEHA